MSSSVSTEKCPKCGRESLFVDYECRTGEYDTFCDFCGFGQHFSWIRDNDFEIVRKDSIYPLSEVFLVVRNCETDEVYLEKPVSEIPNFSSDSVYMYLNHKDGYRYDEFKDGINNFYWISGETRKRLYSWGNELDVDIVNNNMIVHEVETEFEEHGGYGHILVFEDTCSKQHAFEKGTTKAEAIKAIEDAKNNPNRKEMLATWYNPETQSYEILFGEYRNYVEPQRDGEISVDKVSEDELPF